MQPGRNDPCPCGSGKKYKHCHLLADEARAPEDPAWRRIRRMIEGLTEALLGTAARHFGPRGIEQAWGEFNLSTGGKAFDPRSPHMQVFVPWYFYDWLPGPGDTEVAPAARQIRVGEAYLLGAGRRLDPTLRLYVEACLAAPFSFHEIVSCEPGRGFRLHNVLLGSECDVIEHSGSAHAQAGDLMFAKVVAAGDIAMLDGCGPVVFPPLNKPQIIELRARLERNLGSLTPDLLRQYDSELIDLYLALTEDLLKPSQPMIANTDGDPLNLHEMVFDIDSPRKAFDALKDLAAGTTEKELLGLADFDPAGALVRVEIPWRKLGNAMHATWDNTVLGVMEIEEGRLNASANSARRAAQLRSLIEERLGAGARHRSTKTKSVDSVLGRKRTPRDEAAAKKLEDDNARLAELPEVKAAVTEMLRAHYRKWADLSIPALANRTPREAVRDADGREAVEALILQMERNGASQRSPLDPAIVQELRETLGLEARW